MKEILHLLHKRLLHACLFAIFILTVFSYSATAQNNPETIVTAIVKEANQNSQLKYIGHELCGYSLWSNGFGVNKIFDAHTIKIPIVDIALEDYGLLFRLTESGKQPRVSVFTQSKELGSVPTFNTLAEIKGTEKPNEYVMLSAHFDSWDAGTGATDNGTGRVVNLGGSGYAKAKDYLTRWLAPVPNEIKDSVKINFPGTPGGGGSDN